MDVRLTAADGYTAQRSYSIASAPAESTVELTVQAVDDGEVSPYLVGLAEPGDTFEVRGPVGGYFIWDSDDPSPVLLVAGGSGVVPLMSMVRARADLGSRVPFRLVYSVRDPATVLYHDELLRRARDDHGLDVSYVFTRSAPPAVAGDSGPPRRPVAGRGRLARGLRARRASCAGRPGSSRRRPTCSSTRGMPPTTSGPSASVRPEDDMTDVWVDGNELAGALRELFTVDITTARGRCVGCGREGSSPRRSSSSGAPAGSPAARAATAY